MEQQSASKERKRCRRMEKTRMREADIVPRGLRAYLDRLARDKTKIDDRIRARKGNKRPPEMQHTINQDLTLPSNKAIVAIG